MKSPQWLHTSVSSWLSSVQTLSAKATIHAHLEMNVFGITHMRKSCQKHGLWKWWETCQKPWSTPRPRCKRKGEQNYTEVWSLWTLPHVNTSLCIILAQTAATETRQIQQIYCTPERSVSRPQSSGTWAR